MQKKKADKYFLWLIHNYLMSLAAKPEAYVQNSPSKKTNLPNKGC